MIKDSEKKFQLKIVMVLLGLIGCMSLARAIDRRGNSSATNEKNDVQRTDFLKVINF